ncbi:hypothetical protein [Lentzea sp. NPDC051838]|uniref:hypothetical protein n=1 Tax=Lentzea sp. NPDC051838 TaxID=3154849 RepID=UPI00341FE888
MPRRLLGMGGCGLPQPAQRSFHCGLSNQSDEDDDRHHDAQPEETVDDERHPVDGAARNLRVSGHDLVADTELRTILGNFPLSSLATFTGLGITNDLIRRLT